MAVIKTKVFKSKKENISSSNESKKKQKQKRKFFTYSLKNIQDALKDITNGTPISTASRTHQVPRSTLRRKLDAKCPSSTGRVGRESALGPKIEKAIVDWAVELCQGGFPITKPNLIETVSQIVKKTGIQTPFTKNTPGRKWFENFMERNPILSHKKSEYLSRTRALTSESSIRCWFSSVRDLLSADELKVLEHPERVFNMDETAMCLGVSGDYVIAQRGKSCYSASGNSDKENITTLFAVNAKGEVAPPLTVYKYKRLPENSVMKAPEGWGIGKTLNGWMTCVAMYEYFGNIFNKYLLDEKISKPVIVFLDGHVSHMSYDLSEFCKQQQIILVCLPPNATYILQPLDVSVFAPLKKRWQKFIRDWRLSHNGLDIQKFEVPEALSKIIKYKHKKNETDKKKKEKEIFNKKEKEEEEKFTKSIIAGFKACGLYPFNSDNVDYSKCIKTTFGGVAVQEVKSMPSRPDSDNVCLLEKLEKKIDADILKQFRDIKIKNLNWTGSTEYSMLFSTWSTIYDETYTVNKTGTTENVQDQIDTQFQNEFPDKGSDLEFEDTFSSNSDLNNNFPNDIFSGCVTTNNSLHNDTEITTEETELDDINSSYVDVTIKRTDSESVPIIDLSDKRLDELLDKSMPRLSDEPTVQNSEVQEESSSIESEATLPTPATNDDSTDIKFNSSTQSVLSDVLVYPCQSEPQKKKGKKQRIYLPSSHQTNV